MSLQKRFQKKIKLQSTRRRNSVKNRQISRGTKLRVSVFRSLNHIHGQIINDKEQKTLCSFSSLKLKDAKGDKTSIAKQVGIELGKIALQNNVKDVFFDRGKYLYHGRVSAFAQGLRESGLQF
ncbi:50S ribosomal protein L18 [Candidatus Babeliales bacterium]|nr:50S ribosomal protein L18 [Candidatus Babeliales bacterium]